MSDKSRFELYFHIIGEARLGIPDSISLKKKICLFFYFTNKKNKRSKHLRMKHG